MTPSAPLSVVMAWLAEPTTATDEVLPPGLCVIGSTVGMDNLNAAEDACDSWLALRGSCRGLRRERGVKNLRRARDTAFYHLEVYEEWRQQVARESLIETPLDFSSDSAFEHGMW